MKIAIDASQTVYETGVSTYTKNLVSNLLKIDKSNEYLIFGSSLRRYEDLKLALSHYPSNKVFRIPPGVFEFLANVVHFPKIEKAIGKVDVYHSSDWAQFASSAFKVTTVHDLAPILLRKFTNEKIVEVHKRKLNWVLKEVDRIIVPSQSTKTDLLRLGANEGRIRVVYEAVGPLFKQASQEEVEKLKTKYKIFGRYILAIGVNPRKNTRRIVESFSRAKGKDLKLVVIGYRYTDIPEGRGVIFTGHVPSSEMPVFFSGAEALVFPSLYEGFGLPILEAFACGCPVVTSNISSMPEVAGEASVLVDPYDVESIAEGIRKALRGKIGLVKKGYKQVQKFSWEENARKTLEVYNEAKNTSST